MLPDYHLRRPQVISCRRQGTFWLTPLLLRVLWHCVQSRHLSSLVIPTKTMRLVEDKQRLTSAPYGPGAASPSLICSSHYVILRSVKLLTSDPVSENGRSVETNGQPTVFTVKTSHVPFDTWSLLCTVGPMQHFVSSCSRFLWWQLKKPWGYVSY
jgi:hypothetical protein